MFSLQDTLYTASLQVAPLLADEDVPHTFMDPFTSPLLSVLRQILYMPYEWRKLILDFTRVQSPLTSNNCLRDRLSEIRVTQVPYLSVVGQKKYLAYIKKQKLRFPKFQETIDLVFSFYSWRALKLLGQLPGSISYFVLRTSWTHPLCRRIPQGEWRTYHQGSRCFAAVVKTAMCGLEHPILRILLDETPPWWWGYSKESTGADILIIYVHNAIYRFSDPDVVTGTAATLFTYVSGRQSEDSSSN